ncbi:MAG TPA: lysylphosphatidylglycerol synthase transmembrane domain-containing protein [Gemmatimonadaceae bacterium]|nr:lysylphosphatidylglycerol synthase transmembrane domain-containing protein [Gemmatimonadaceae bacterium]
MKRWLGWLLVAALIALAFAYGPRVDWAHTAEALRGASPAYLIAAAAVNLLSMALKAIRWWLFLRSLGVTSLGLVMRAAFAGYGLNTILPANGGEAARIVFVARRTQLPSAPIVATVAWDRIFDIAGYVALIAGATLVFRLPPNMSIWKVPAAALLAATVAIVAWLARRRHRTPDDVLAEQRPADASWVKRARLYVVRVAHSLSALSDPRAFGWATVLTIGAWVTQILTFDLGARAVDLDLPLAGTVAALILVNVGYAVRATPGNVGLYQAAFAAAVVKPFGVPAALAFAASLLLQAVQMIPVALVGLAAMPGLVAGGRRRAAEASPEPRSPAGARDVVR